MKMGTTVDNNKLVSSSTKIENKLKGMQDKSNGMERNIEHGKAFPSFPAKKCRLLTVMPSVEM